MVRTRQTLSRDIRKHKPDYSVILIVGVMLIIGLIVLYSIGPALQQSTGITIGRQIGSITAGLVAFLITFFVPLSFWLRIKTFLVWAAVIATSLLIFAPGGVINPDVKGAKRWLIFGPLSFQPAELIKFALLIYLAAFLAHRVKHNKVHDLQETIIPVAIITAVLGVVVVILQKDLGSMLVITSIVLAMLYMAGVRIGHLSGFVGGLAAAGFVAVLIAPHRLERLSTFIDPSVDAEGAGYHINQALIAVGSGGLFGLGLGKSVQAHGYLPEAANDSIFAIYAEKFGFVGSILVVALMGYLLFKLAKIVEHAPNTYLRLLAAGIFAWIGSHIIINVGAILGLMPLTGITLPFLSYGGSSMLFIMAATGLAMNISRYSVHHRVVALRREGIR